MHKSTKKKNSTQIRAAEHIETTCHTCADEEHQKRGSCLLD